MKLLIISYNNNYDKLNIINFNPTLYLIKNIFPEVKKCQFVELVQNVEEKIIEKLAILYDKYDFLLLLDNKRKFFINENKLYNFINENKEKTFIGKTKGKEGIQYDSFIPISLDYSCLLINNNKLTKEDFSLITEQKEGNIFFPFFSRIYYKYYNDIYVSKIPGVEEESFHRLIII